MNKIQSTTGRILFALPLVVFGLFHFMNAKMMAGALPPTFPAPIFLIYFTGAALIAAAVAIMINKFVLYAMWGLAFFLVVTIITVHVPALSNPAMAQMAMPGLL